MSARRSLLITAMFLASLATLPAQLATVTVSTSGPVVKIPSTFMGLAHETTSPGNPVGSDQILGQASTGIDYVYRQLISNLTAPAYSNGPIMIRIGGGGTQALHTAMNVTPYKELYQANGALFVLEVNAQTATLAEAKDQLSSYYGQMPAGSVLAYEIGNEPDLLYASGYAGFQTYATILHNWLVGMRTRVPSSVTFAAPACAVYSCLAAWSQKGIMAAESDYLSIYSTHYYATWNYSPTVDYFLQPYVYTQPAAMAQEVAAAHHMGLKYIVDEWQSNSAASIMHDNDGDARWVSMQFQSALWGLKSLFDMAATGVDTVYVFGNISACGTGSCDNPVNFAEILIHSGTPNTFTLTHVWPIYYGMLAFQQATANHSVLYPTAIAAGTSSNVSAYDTIDASAVERITLVNLDKTASGNVSVTPQTTHASARVCYLSALAHTPLAAYQSTSDVTLCGQTFDGSSDGVIHNAASYTTITPTAGVYSVPLAVTQGAVITFQ